MKKRDLILIILSLLFTQTFFSQERVNKSIPIIGTKINSQLTKATGWLLNPEGQWISRTNKIPSFIENQYKILIDFEFNGLGIDNFISYQLRDVKIQDSTYAILIKKYKDGYFKYSSIKEGWTAYNSVDYYVFDKKELSKLDSIRNDTINLVRINVLYSKSIEWINNATYISDIQKEILKQVEETKSKYNAENSLIFHIAPYRKKNIVQFQIYSSYGSNDLINGVFSEYKVTDPNGKYSWDTKKIYLTDELFKYCYFETDVLTFNNFLKIGK